MTTKTIFIGVGIAGCLGFAWWPRKSSPPAVSRSRQPPVAVATGRPEPANPPLPESNVESSVDQPRPRKRVSRADIDRRDAFRAQLRETMASGDPANQDRVYAILAEWMQHDPAGAGRFAKSLPSGRWRELIVQRVAQIWAVQGLESAERWAARLPDGSERDASEAAICFQVAQTDARQAVKSAERHGLGAQPGGTLENLVQQWAGQDLAAAAAWVMERPASEERNQLLGRLAYVESQAEPAAAANLVVGQISAGPVQNEAAMTVLHQWAERDMPAATAWANQFPPGAFRDRAETELENLAAYSR